MKDLIRKMNEEERKIREVHSPRYCRFVESRINIVLRKERLDSFKTKNKKIDRMRRQKRPKKEDMYRVPVINLSSVTLSEEESEALRYGLQHSFIDRNKYIKQNLAVEMEALADNTNDKVKQEDKETYHEFLVKYTNIFSKNVYDTKDYTYNKLKELTNNPNIVILEGDKETAIVIMNKEDYVNKMNQMIDAGIEDGTYAESDDTTLEDLKHFKQFLQRNFSDHPKYKKMAPTSHRPARMYGSAKTHKFDSYDEITVENLKLRPIMDQCGTMVYTAAQIIAEYIRPLNDSKYIIQDTLKFPNILAEQDLKTDEEDISYDVESLFTNVPVDETIEYILDEIYINKRLKPLSKNRLIMKRLLKKLTSDCLFSINGRLMKQQDGCSMGSPLSVDFSGIFMTKLEKDVVYPENPILYKRFVDDVFNRKKKGDEDTLLPKLNAYHPKIRFTVEKDLTKFLDTKLQLEDGKYKTSVNRNRKLPTHWTSKIPKKIKRNIITNDLHRARKISTVFKEEVDVIKGKYEKAGYPEKYINSIIRDFEEKEKRPQRNPEDETEEKSFVPIRVPFCEKNEKVTKHFLEKLKEFTGNKFKLGIVWQTKKIKTLCKLKDDVKHKANVIYKGTSIDNPEQSYIGETRLIAEERWTQHEDPNHNSAPSKYLNENPGDRLEWEIISSSSSNAFRRKIHEALFICKFKPTLNRQIEHRKLILFRNGVT